jgi:hypothetical protein
MSLHRIAVVARRFAPGMVGCMMVLPLLFVACAAQETQDENATLTLHVYTNLIQIPVLVLGPFQDYVPKVDPKAVTVTVGDGKPFPPTHIRTEGDDPLTLAIMLDVSDSEGNLAPELGHALEKLGQQSLHPQDRVAIYALDCGLLRASDFVASDATVLKAAGELASKDITPRTNKHRRNCGDTLRFLDSLMIVSNQLSHQQGRRVLLAISSGHDSGSTVTADQIHQLANRTGVAIFGLAEPGVGASGGRGGRGAGPPPTSSGGSKPEFNDLCEATGGLARYTSADALPKALDTLVKMLRERIIVEFPRPTGVGTGPHAIHVAIAKTNDFIRPAGISVPIPDSHILTDPNTIHPGESSPPEPVAPAPPNPPH